MRAEWVQIAGLSLIVVATAAVLGVEGGLLVAGVAATLYGVAMEDD